ncbi:MAG: hypothetical protein R6V01_08545, partial [Thermoplasmatota archaeon]
MMGKNGLLKIAVILFITALLVLVVRLAFNEKEGVDSDEGLEPMFMYYSDDQDNSLNIVGKEKVDDEVPDHTVFDYSEENIIEEEEVMDIAGIFDDRISVFSMDKENENGLDVYFFEDGINEYRKELKIIENGNIHYENRKMIGFTDEMTDEELMEISYVYVD